MEQKDDDARPVGSEQSATSVSASPILAEDLLLLLFQPESGFSGSGTIAGEGTLYYVLAGAVLADLALGGHVRTGTGRLGGVTVEAVDDNPPADPILKATWDYVAEKTPGVQTVLAAQGPALREPLLDRIVERGHLRRSPRKFLGLFNTTALEEGDGTRRADLLADVRTVLVDGTDPAPSTAALAALLYGSGTLPQFDRDIPWTSPVITRAEELKDGNWGAQAAAKAVTRTITATIVSSVVVATFALPRA